VPLTNASGQLLKKPKKPKQPKAAAKRSAKGVPGNWVGFDAPAGRARPGTAEPGGRKTAAKPRSR
jgi:hypothetical protein